MHNDFQDNVVAALWLFINAHDIADHNTLDNHQK